ncbi:efflux RND transporter permease subunit [bacterium]|nr:efflux RND transporter permease subunit [bacterium]
MALSTVSIRRPILTIVMSIAILLFGVIGFTFLGVREYPIIDLPTITVSTTYPGANADVIQSQITEPLEESVNGIDGIRSLTSISAEGRSTIRVEFTLQTDIEAAANDVRDRVSRAGRLLPPDVDPPVVYKADISSMAVLLMTLQSGDRSLVELSDIAAYTVKEKVQTIPGVSQVQIWGEKRYAMRLRMDPKKLAAYGITPIDVQNALARENIELPSGRIEGTETEFTLRTLVRLRTPEDFNNLILREKDGAAVRFRDVGVAELGPENERTLMRRDRLPMVGVGLVPLAGANSIEIVDEFYRRLKQIREELPEDVQAGIAFDMTQFIRRSITEVEETIFIAFFLVIVIIYLFLRDWRTTLIPMLAIPISLIGAFFIMYIMNFSINVLTLLGIVLAIGIVVDDAIVVLENIYDKVESGMDPIQASIRGSNEIFFAIVSTTVVLASVFLPIVFLQGITGRLFREFGIVIAGAIIISAFVALTLTPMMSSRFLKNIGHHNRFYNRTEPFFVSLTEGFGRSLDAVLRKKWIALAIIAAALAMILGFGSQLSSELAPIEDRSAVRVGVTAPEGTSFESMDRVMAGVIDDLTQLIPEKEGLISNTAPGYGGGSAVNSGNVRVMLVDPARRKRTQMEIAEELAKHFRPFTNARVIISQDQSVGGTMRGGLPIQYVIKAPNLETLQEVIPRFMDLASHDSVFSAVDVNLKFNKPELVLSIERNKAAALGVSASAVAQTLQLAYSGQRYGFFLIDDRQYQIIGQIRRGDRSDPSNLKALRVRNNRGELIQLDNLIRVEESARPPQLYRYDRWVSATVSANPAQGFTIGDGLAEMDRIAERVLDPSCSTALAGLSKEYAESSSSLIFTFLLALVLIYLVLAAQFESFIDPFIIMLTVPLALSGSLLFLWYFNQTFNIFSQIGQIMLIGLVTKTGILIVEFANQRRAQGLSAVEAARDATVQRFRPILMTALSTILGAMPIALSIGAGASNRVSMGIAVIGGMLFSTALSLYVVPVLYVLLTGRRSRKIISDR